MFDLSKIFLFFGLIKCLTQTWDYLKSSVELGSSESVYTSYATFDGTIIKKKKKDSLTELYINNSSLENDIILDPFMGSGSTGVACLNTNRNFIGIELNKDYYETAEKRLNNR